MEQFTFFWKSASPFSQWHFAKFKIDGITFNCTEQYMMYKKAMLFDDVDIAQQVLDTQMPVDQKRLGRKVKNFNKEVWENNCKEIVYEGNYAKFTQNKHLKEKLLSTSGTTLVEASPYDDIWGIRLSADNPKAKDRSQWQGKNWLGEILTQLREDIISS